MKGLIAIDVDGTATAEHDTLPKRVEEYFSQLISEGWSLAFITGRSFPRTAFLLEGIKGLYYLAVQNGAVLYEMPSERILSQALIPAKIAEYFFSCTLEEPTGPVIYRADQEQDHLYFMKGSFSPELEDYIKRRAHLFGEMCEEITSFDNMKDLSIVCFKSYGMRESLERICERAQSIHLPLSFSLIKDPFDPTTSLLQATKQGVDKGYALKKLKSLLNITTPVIVCGDDENDLSMFAQGTCIVVMETAPSKILKLADIVAPSAKNLGIIEGIMNALKKNNIEQRKRGYP